MLLYSWQHFVLLVLVHNGQTSHHHPRELRPLHSCVCFGHGWCFSTDRQHTSKSPTIRVLSSWLETPIGNYQSWGLFAIIPVVAVCFDAVDHVEVGVKMAAWGHVFLEFGTGIIFWVCGNSLKRVVDESLRRNSARSEAAAAAAAAAGGVVGAAEIADEGSKDTLVAVREKATRMTYFIVQQVCGK